MAQDATTVPKDGEPRSLEELLVRFESENDANDPRLGNNLRMLIDRSPSLKADLEDAAAKGNLERIALFAPGANANNSGAEYGFLSKTITLSAGELIDAHKPGRIDEELIFKLGHEAWHAKNRDLMKEHKDAFEEAVYAIAESLDGAHDYTEAVGQFIENRRMEESAAHIGGFNAISSMVLARNPNADLEDIYSAHPARLKDFIEKDESGRRYSMKGEMSIDGEMRMLFDKKNISGMKSNYFDKSAEEAKLGPNKDWDYHHYYADEAFRRIYAAENAVAEHWQKNGRPDVQIQPIIVDFDVLKIDPFKVQPKYGVVDRSDSPSLSEPQSNQSEPPADDITNEKHLGHARYKEAVHAIEHSCNIPFGIFTGDRLCQTAANLAYASLAGEERSGIGGCNQALSRIDYAVFNKDRSGLICGEGEFGSFTSKHALLLGAQDNANSLSITSQRMQDLLQDSQKVMLANPESRQALAQPTMEPVPSGPRR